MKDVEYERLIEEPAQNVPDEVIAQESLKAIRERKQFYKLHPELNTVAKTGRFARMIIRNNTVHKTYKCPECGANMKFHKIIFAKPNALHNQWYCKSCGHHSKNPAKEVENE